MSESAKHTKQQNIFTKLKNLFSRKQPKSEPPDKPLSEKEYQEQRYRLFEDKFN